MKISRKAIQRSREKQLVDLVISMCFLVTVLVLNGVFGFGKERLNRFSEEFAKTMHDYRNRYDEVALEALTKHAREKGIEVDWAA
jgi:hypothetical protein